MPRTARASVGGICYHVINRGNGGARVFHDEMDYRRFLRQFLRARSRLPMRVAGWCVMPNHFHFVLWPYNDGDLGHFMHRWMTGHVVAHRKRHGTIGHIWQGRFKAFPIQQDSHLFVVLRYVERNPLRANLVDQAEKWPWSSISATGPRLPLESPIERPADWVDVVDEPQSEAELLALRKCVNRQRPYGDQAWARAWDIHVT